MTSLLSGTKQTFESGTGYYINVGSLMGKIYARTEPASNTGTAGGAFSTAMWVFSSPVGMGPTAFAALSTALVGAGQSILKDMGRTVVSSTRTFRKVQLVQAGSVAPSTFGVGGPSTSGESYFTGYIELGIGGEGSATPANCAPVARYGR
jgi:hypothetical protein